MSSVLKIFGLAVICTILVFVTLVAIGVGSSPSSHVPAAESMPPVTLLDGVVREDHRFPCGPTTCAGWLYRPRDVEQPPIIVMGNGFSGTRDVGMPVFAETFARNGFAAFAFDYRYFGASGGSPRQLLNPWMQLDDWRAAVSFVRTLDEVNGEKLALWGTSMAGGLVVVIGAEDPGVSAIIAQVPAVDTDATAEGPQPTLGWVVRLLFTGWADIIQSIFSDTALMIPAFAPAGEFGMIPDGQSFNEVQTLMVPGSTYQNAIAARSFMTFDEYNPTVAWSNIKAPTLLLATQQDRLAPFEAVEAFANSNENVTMETFEGGHFDIYQKPLSDWGTKREVGFLEKVLR